MMTLDQAADIAANINEQAHQETWDAWVQAERLEHGDDDEDLIRAQDQRELASRQQSEWFRDLFYDLREDQQHSIAHWLEHDPDFREQFTSWFGEEEFHRVFGGLDLSDGGDPD